MGTQEGFDKAKKIYERGAYSHPVATLRIIGGVPKKIDHGNLVIGMTDNHKAVYSTVTTIHEIDGNNLIVAYDSSSIRGDYIPCEVGGSPHPFTEGCTFGILIAFHLCFHLCVCARTRVCLRVFDAARALHLTMCSVRCCFLTISMC